MLAILAFASLAAAQPAHSPASAPEPARDWRAVGESNLGSRMAYDRASIHLDRAAMVASFDYRLVREDSYRIARVELRCADRMVRVVRTSRYSAAGALLGSDEVPSGWASVPADSSFLVAAEEACGPRPAPGGG